MVFVMSDVYSVELCERPVHRLRALDVRMLGKALAHPFLALKGADGQVVKELHGTWSDAATNSQTKPAQWMEAALAGGAAAEGVVPRTVDAMRYAFNFGASGRVPVNRMVELNGSRHYNSAVARHTVYAPGDDVSARWDDLVQLAKKVDEMRFPYVRYAIGDGVNCQTSMREILLRSGAFNSVSLPQLSLADAGWSCSYRLPLKEDMEAHYLRMEAGREYHP